MTDPGTLQECQARLEYTRNQLLDAWEMIRDNDKYFHLYTRLSKGLLYVQTLPADDRLLALDRLLGECGLLHEESREQALGAPGHSERPGPEPTGERIVR